MVKYPGDLTPLHVCEGSSKVCSVHPSSWQLVWGTGNSLLSAESEPGHACYVVTGSGLSIRTSYLAMIVMQGWYSQLDLQAGWNCCSSYLTSHEAKGNKFQVLWLPDQG